MNNIENSLPENTDNLEKHLSEQMFLQSSISTQILDSEGWCVRINPKLSELFGVEPQHIEGKVYNIFMDEAVIQGGVLPHLHKVFYEGIPTTWEILFDIGIASESQNIKVQKKKKVWFRNWAFPIFDENGQLKHVIIQHINIDQEKQNMESLKNSDRVFNHALDMLCIAGYDGYFKVLNPSWKRVLGWSEEELLSKPWISYVHPDDVEDTKNIKATLVDGKAVFQFENRYICKDGAVKWLSWNSYPYPEEQLMYGVARDITEKIREEHLRIISYDVAHAVVVSENMEQLIRLIRQKLTPMVETPNFYLALYDEKTGMLKIPYAEDEKDEIYTWPADRSATGLVIKNKKSMLLKRADVNKLIEEGVIDLVGTLSETWLGVPLFDESKVIGAIAIQSYDVPDAFDNTTISILEFISGQISMALQRKKIIDALVEAKNKAEESDRLKTSFLNNLSHEIRTPLNAIVGFSQFLNEPALSPERTEHITGVICRSSDQLLSIINDIINISAIEAGAVEVNHRKTNINTIMKHVFESLQYKAEEKGIHLVYKSGLSDAEASSITDETKLTQVLINLVDNAIKYTHAGFVELRGSLRNGMYQFSVSDTGIGIELHLQKDVFNRFHQVETSSSSTMGGLGLGLPIAKSFVELMGGNMWVESSPGKGTRFFFTIPQKQVSASDRQEIYMSTHETSGNKKHAVVLVAEDEETNFELTEVILSTYGVEVLHAWHGQEAVSMCENNPEINLVLMDIKMPVMNGYEATRRIKEIRPALPIVALTAYALLGDKEKALNAGCDDYLPKPVSLKDFQKMIEKFLS